MRVIFSRKGFDTGSGGAPSPIIDGCPVSLPIPTSGKSVTTYGDLGLGEIVEKATRGRIGRDHLCHEDPMFTGEECFFGQCGAAQSHLQNQGVGIGDVFLFFGLFNDEITRERHHRIFGYLRIAEILLLGRNVVSYPCLALLPRAHPHSIGERAANNTVYRGHGSTARHAGDGLRLTQPGGPLRHWIVPSWLQSKGLTFHGSQDRWFANNRLEIVSRGQEFVADIGDDAEPRQWLDKVVESIEA